MPAKRCAKLLFGMHLLLTGIASGQNPTIPNQIVLQPIRHLRKGIDLWPLIAYPRNSSTEQINKSLTGLNTQLAESVRGCDKDIRNWVKFTHDTTAKADIEGDWERRVEVTMAGPRFLSLKATEDYFCGGNHPDDETEPLVFDVTTGSLIDWPAMLPNANDAAAKAWEFRGAESLSTVTLPRLEELNLRKAVPDCKDAFQHPQSFLLWLDARDGTIVAEAADLPHVVQACAEEIRLNTAAARDLGFSDELLQAVEEAHKASAGKQKPKFAPQPPPPAPPTPAHLH